MSRERPVYVVNSRLPVYKVTYGDGLSDVVTGLFTRIAPKILPIGKELASKVTGDVGDEVVKETVMRAFNASKEKTVSLIKSLGFSRKTPVKLPSTDEILSPIDKEIDELAKQKLATNAGSGRRLSI